MNPLRRAWTYWTAKPPAWILEISKMESGDEVREAIESPEWREKHGFADPFATELREELVAASARQNLRRRRRRLVLNRITGMVVFGTWILVFDHYNPEVPVMWVSGTIIVGGLGMVIYSFGD